MRNLDVEGANGGLDTNYHGKAMAAVEALLEKMMISLIFM